MKKISNLIPSWEFLAALFFLVYFLIGIAIYKDYGAAWDEIYQESLAQANNTYVFRGDKILFELPNKFYGPIYVMSVTWLGRFFGFYTDDFTMLSQSSLMFRHLVNFLVSFTGSVFFFLLCRYKFRDTKIALLGVIFLVLSPRLFADSFYNPKDSPLMVFFIISMYCLLRYFDKKTFGRLIALSVASAITIDIRITAVIIPAIIIFFYALDFFTKKKRAERNIVTFHLVIYLIITSFLTFLMWPYLWTNPAAHFIEAWQSFSRYHTGITNLYFGYYIDAESIPWHYLPVWMMVTIPPLYLVLFAAGILSYFSQIRGNIRKFFLSNRSDVMVLVWFFIPLFAVILLNSTLYNGWRHLFFVYPAFLLIVLAGFIKVMQVLEKSKLKNLKIYFIFLIIFSQLYLIKIMISYHPYQNLYFNFLTKDSNTARKYFETDYWGMPYRKGLEYIASVDKSERIPIRVETAAGEVNAWILPEHDRRRLKFVNLKGDPKYYITTFYVTRVEPSQQELYSVTVDGAKIMSVYKLR